jgi:glycosyltransferase involved in cell wall biosynthesis
LLGDDERGLLYEPGDIPALAAAILALATDVALRERLVAAARAWAQPLGSTLRYAQEVANVVDEAVA